VGRVGGILDCAGGMAARTDEDLTDRSFKFSCDVFDYCDELVRLTGIAPRIARQLFDAAGSVGANRAEAKSAYSRRDFRAKNAISLREAREANFWLRLADAKRLGTATLRQRLLDESNQLISIYVEVVRNLKDR
jgi:four helix bundle protein